MSVCVWVCLYIIVLLVLVFTTAVKILSIYNIPSFSPVSSLWSYTLASHPSILNLFGINLSSFSFFISFFLALFHSFFEYPGCLLLRVDFLSLQGAGASLSLRCAGFSFVVASSVADHGL